MSDFAASYEAHDVEVNGRALRAYRTGGDKPQVIYVHGYTDSALSAKMLIDELKGWAETAKGLPPVIQREAGQVDLPEFGS